MPVPEDYRLYQTLSAALRQMGKSFMRELPAATVSLHLHILDGRTRLDVYDGRGRIIASLPSHQTSPLFRAAIERLGKERCPDSQGVVSPI